MSLRPLDRIALGEQKSRLKARRFAAEAADRAVSALLWFEEYATVKGIPSPGPHLRADAIKVQGDLVASATPDADIALSYVRRALGLRPGFSEQILSKAIELAQADLRAAEEDPAL